MSGLRCACKRTRCVCGERAGALPARASLSTLWPRVRFSVATFITNTLQQRERRAQNKNCVAHCQCAVAHTAPHTLATLAGAARPRRALSLMAQLALTCLLIRA